jgi:hypothetical protein
MRKLDSNWRRHGPSVWPDRPFPALLPATTAATYVLSSIFSSNEKTENENSYRYTLLRANHSVKSRNTLSAEKREQIIAALRANPNVTQVAKQFAPVNKSTVWRIAKAEGIEIATRPAYYRHGGRKL